MIRGYSQRVIVLFGGYLLGWPEENLQFSSVKWQLKISYGRH